MEAFGEIKNVIVTANLCPVRSAPTTEVLKPPLSRSLLITFWCITAVCPVPLELHKAHTPG